jgi:hypothetical protein
MSNPIEQFPGSGKSAATPKAGKRAKAKKEYKKRKSNAGRPKTPISYVIEGLKKNKFRNKELKWAIEQVQEHERQKAVNRGEIVPPNSNPGIPREYWAKRGKRQAETQIAVSEDSEDFAGVPDPPHKPEVNRISKAEAERVKAEQELARKEQEAKEQFEKSAFLTIEDQQKYTNVIRNGYRSTGINFRLPDGSLVDHEGRDMSNCDPYCLSVTPTISVKDSPKPGLVLAEKDRVLQWTEKPEQPKPAKPIIQGLDLWAKLPMPKPETDEVLVSAGFRVDGALVMPVTRKSE